MPAAGIYIGTLSHRRFTPRAHQFNYELFMVMLDIDEIPELMKVSGLAAFNRFNWASFHDEDHFGDPALPLRTRVEREASRHGVELPDGKIYLLTHLRYLGYAFNPVSFFYCHDRDGTLRAVLAEVNNTFGESRNYWLTAANEVGHRWGLRQYRSNKSLHVSPFMPMELGYAFAMSEPEQNLTVHMSTIDGETTTFEALLRLEYQEWTARNLRMALLRYPWMTMKVILAIHWQALRLFFKNVPVFSNPTGRRWKVW